MLLQSKELRQKSLESGKNVLLSVVFILTFTSPNFFSPLVKRKCLHYNSSYPFLSYGPEQ